LQPDAFLNFLINLFRKTSKPAARISFVSDYRKGIEFCLFCYGLMNFEEYIFLVLE